MGRKEWDVWNKMCNVLEREKKWAADKYYKNKTTLLRKPAGKKIKLDLLSMLMILLQIYTRIFPYSFVVNH